ncbi:MAG: UDP-N-acetylmuramoyl-tripeptide--D-alanyl-D-alanine ligase [Candidatus Paceibacterota bacterium]
MLKRFFKKILVFLLQTEARLIVRKYEPKIIAVSGTVGKTSTKEAIYAALGNKISIRKSKKSYNSEIGVPLTIIGGETGWTNVFAWVSNLFKGLKVLASEGEYPEWLILEMGVDRPGDMKKLISWVKPKIAVITALGDVPVHIEYFKDAEELKREKGKLVQALKEENYAIINGDDASAMELAKKTKANVLTFGFMEGLDMRASNYYLTPEGITFKVDYKGNIVPIRLSGIFGKQAVYTALAALGVGSAMGLNMIEMAESLSKYKSPPGRLNLLEGIKGSMILDDSYNSSPLAVMAALEVLKDMPAKRKIATLGDMLELGKYTIEEHRKVGRLVKEVANVLFTIGPRSKFTAEEARVAGMSAENIFEFSTSDEAKVKVQEIIQEGDLILIKGSQGTRTEKITEEIMSHPENKNELLVRQEPEWARR